MITQIFMCTKPRMKHKNKGTASLSVEYYLNSLTDYHERVRLKGLLNSNPTFKNDFATRFQQFDQLLDILFSVDRNIMDMDALLHNICTVKRSDNADINNMYNYLIEDILEELLENTPVDVSHSITQQLDKALQALSIYPDVEKTLSNYL